MRYATNIEHDGECLDCQDYEKKIDKLYQRESTHQEMYQTSMQNLVEANKEKAELLEALKMANDLLLTTYPTFKEWPEAKLFESIITKYEQK